jgi:tRNA-splicing endonuclease subunit Sen34
MEEEEEEEDNERNRTVVVDEITSKLPQTTVHLDEQTNQALIWTAEEYRIVRQKHRIVGSLLGSLPGYRQQDATRGLPVLLSKEETYVLERNGWAKVKKRRRGGFSVLEEEEEGGEETMVEMDAKEKKREQAKLRARKASKKSQWGGAAKKKQKTAAAAAVKKKKEEEDEEKTIKSDKIVDWEQVLGKTSSVVLPLTSEMDARLDEPAVEEEEEEDAFHERVWRKMSKIDRYKCAVFKDLHEKGFTMTSAAKFGGDYLAYPGDPMLFHAYFTVRVLERGEKMTPLSCSSVTRMAHAARKNVVFAFCGEEGDEGGGSDDSVLRIRYFTCVPDIELSSNRGF